MQSTDNINRASFLNGAVYLISNLLDTDKQLPLKECFKKDKIRFESFVINKNFSQKVTKFNFLYDPPALEMIFSIKHSIMLSSQQKKSHSCNSKIDRAINFKLNERFGGFNRFISVKKLADIYCQGNCLYAFLVILNTYFQCIVLSFKQPILYQ